MYAGTIKSVELPKTGKVKILKNGYVYWLNESKWNNELKRTVDNRVAIGKIDPSQPGMLFPNKRFFDLFPSGCQPTTRKETKQDISVAVQPSADLVEAGVFSDRLNFGPYLALTTAAEKTGCLDALRKSFPKLWTRILAVALHSIDAQNSVSQDFPSWFFHNYCGIGKNLSSGEISVLYEELAKDVASIRTFMSLFRENYFGFMPHAVEHVLAFDSTNQNTASHGISLAEYGHAKVKEGLPNINTAMFVDQVTGIPLYYEHFCGSVLDKTQTPYTMEKIRDLGFTKLFVMMDRGYFSEDVVKALNGIEFGLMCPDNSNLVKDIIGNYAPSIKDCERYYVPEENVYGIHLENYQFSGKGYDAYLFYDPKRAEDEKETIHLKVNLLIKAALKQKRFSKKLQDRYSPWLTIEQAEKDPKTKRCFKVTANAVAVQECIDKAGLFVVLSNAGLDAASMIRIARMRDHGEKAFRRIKSHFGLTKTYLHQAMTYEGKMFVAYVALIIVESYRWFVKPELNRITSTTTATTIGELRKYQIQLKTDGSWMPQYALTKKQKQLFTCLGLTPDEVENQARNIRLRV